MADEYLKRIEADLAREREALAPLESGEMHIGEREGDGPWRDVTPDWIARHKRTIAIYEAILTDIRKREAR